MKARVSRTRTLTQKALRLAPQVIANPQLVPLAARGVHPEQYTRLNLGWLKTAGIRTVLDIGANTGQFTGAIHAVLPEARIFAFEPIPECARQISERHSGTTDRIQVLQFAVGERDDQVVFNRNVYSQSSSLLQLGEAHKESFPWASQTEPINVQLRRLDTLTEGIELRHKVFVKIDVQGYEDRVLEGGERTFREANFVLVETAFEQLYEGETSFENVYDILRTYGFRFAGNLNQIQSPDDGRILHADALFVRH